MKRVKIVFLAVLITALLSGCSASLFTPIDDLISPVSPTGDDAGILAAVDSFCAGGYTVKIPSSGSYTTSFIARDLNKNSDNEAIAFFEPDDKLSTVNMAVLSKENEHWKINGNIVGEGADVNRVDFCDLNNDGSDEIIVCWGIISNSTAFNICVYSLNSDLAPVLLSDSIIASDFICVDINDDGLDELLTFKYSSANESPTAELFSFSDNKKVSLGQTKLDGRIVSFSNIVCDKDKAGVCVYADGACSNGESMVTEILLWSNYYDAVISPFYSYVTGKTGDTSRNNLMVSRDIDGDGKIEIPLDHSISGLPKGITAQNWVSYSNTVLNHKEYSIACENDGYLLALDDGLLSKAKFTYDEDNRELKVFNGDEELFSLLTVVKSGYSSDNYTDYAELMSDSGLMCLVKVNSENSFSITTDTVKSLIYTY